MTSTSGRHHRRSIRLRGYNYAQAGAYFITLCAKDGAHLFGDVTNGVMHLNDAGKIVAEEWARSPSVRSEMILGEWVVMPNHLHGIVIIQNRGGDRPVAPPPADRRGDRPVAPPSRSTCHSSTDHEPADGGGDRRVAPPTQHPSVDGGGDTTQHPSVDGGGDRRVAPTTQHPPADRGGDRPVAPPTQHPSADRRGDRPVAPPSRSTAQHPSVDGGGDLNTPSGPPSRSIGAMVAGFKSAASKRINEMRGTPGLPVWQRNYYEHIIRNTDALDRIRKYIRDNPARWSLEREHALFEEMQTIEQMASMDAEREVPAMNESRSEMEIRKNLKGLVYGS